MALFTIRKHVDAPREKVFEVASDFVNAAGFIRGITGIEMLTDGPVGVGTKFKETRVIMKREATEEMEVTAFDPPESYVLECESCGCRYRSEFRFTPSGGGTDVEMTFEGKGLTVFAKVMSFIMRPMMKMCMKETGKDLDDVKAAAEGKRAGAEAV